MDVPRQHSQIWNEMSKEVGLGRSEKVAKVFGSTGPAHKLYFTLLFSEHKDRLGQIQRVEEIVGQVLSRRTFS